MPARFLKSMQVLILFCLNFLPSSSLKRHSRVSSRFFDQPGHEILKRSIINHHSFINTYHHMRTQNLQQGLRSFPKLEFQKWIVLNIFDKNGVNTVILGPIDEEKMIFELTTQFKVKFLMTIFLKKSQKRAFL